MHTSTGTNPGILTSWAEQGHVREAGKRCSRRFICFFLATLVICSHSSCVCVCSGWLLWYYWVSDKPAREAPTDCTKCFPVTGVNRAQLGWSISGSADRRTGWVCSCFPLSNRSLAGAHGLQIPASCRSVCVCGYIQYCMVTYWNPSTSSTAQDQPL